MSTRFRYTTKSLDRELYRGRRIPVRIGNVIEKTTEKRRGRPIPALVITYQTPDEMIEIVEYEGGEDSIPSSSTLGRLITAFSTKLDIQDLSGPDDNFSPLLDKYIWVNVEPVKTSQGVKYFRWPSTWMTDTEVSEFFKAKLPLHFLPPIKNEIQQIFNGVPFNAIISVASTIRQLKPFMKEVSEALDDKSLVTWIETNTDLRLEDEGDMHVLRRKDSNGTAAASE